MPPFEFSRDEAISSGINSYFRLVGTFRNPPLSPISPLLWTYLFGTSVNASSGMRDIRIHALISATR